MLTTASPRLYDTGYGVERSGQSRRTERLDPHRCKTSNTGLSAAFSVSWQSVCRCPLQCRHHCVGLLGPVDDRAVPPEHVFADSLIVSIEDVRHIANFVGLQPYSYADRHHPLASINAPGPCQAGGEKQSHLRGTTDDLRPGGIAPINEVSHAVAVYPDSGTVRAAHTQLESRLNQCASLHDNAYDFALSKPDPMTLRLIRPGGPTL